MRRTRKEKALVLILILLLAIVAISYITAEGYEQIIEEPIIIEVRKVYNPEKKKYEVDVIYDESLVYIEVNADEEGNITIIVSCAKNKVEDENKAENESEDKNTDKDLGIEFFLNKINEETIKDREPIFTYNQEKKINEVKRKTDKVSIENNDIVNFTARVYNNTDFEVKGGVVIVAIPNGLTFDPNNTINQENEWKMYIEDAKGLLEETHYVRPVINIKIDSLKGLGTINNPYTFE